MRERMKIEMFERGEAGSSTLVDDVLCRLRDLRRRMNDPAEEEKRGLNSALKMFMDKLGEVVKNDILESMKEVAQ